eukprot:9025248-Ditylum_brightwellii.AAC.1
MPHRGYPVRQKKDATHAFVGGIRCPRPYRGSIDQFKNVAIQFKRMHQLSNSSWMMSVKVTPLVPAQRAPARCSNKLNPSGKIVARLWSWLQMFS